MGRETLLRKMNAKKPHGSPRPKRETRREGKGLILFLSLGISPPFLEPGLQSTTLRFEGVHDWKGQCSPYKSTGGGRLSGGGRVLAAGTLFTSLDV